MTTPNLPFNSTTQADLAENVTMPGDLGHALQDHTPGRYAAEAGSRYPSAINGTLAGGPLGTGVLGVVNGMMAGFASTVANADPATIRTTDDLKPLIPGFFDLPLQDIFAPLLNAIMGVGGGVLGGALSDIADFFSGQWDGLEDLGEWVEALVDQLLEAIGVPSLGTLWDKITDLADEVGDWLLDTQNVAGGLFDLIGDLLSNPADVLGSLPMGQITNLIPELAGKASASVVSTLQTTLNQFEDIFNGLVVTPVNDIVGAVANWFNQWFGGGSNNAIPLSQKGAAGGVAPLNGSGKLNTSYLITDTANNVPTLDGSGKLKSAQLPPITGYIPTGDRGAAGGVAPLNGSAVVPLANLPEEVGGTGGSGFGLPYIFLTAAPQSVANNASAAVTWDSQSGTSTVGYTNSNNDWFTLPHSGIWAANFTTPTINGNNGIRMGALRISPSSNYGYRSQPATLGSSVSGTAFFKYSSGEYVALLFQHTQGSTLTSSVDAFYGSGTMHLVFLGAA